jgi:hypothetical protein
VIGFCGELDYRASMHSQTHARQPDNTGRHLDARRTDRHWRASPTRKPPIVRARRFDPKRALALGFKTEASFDEIIRIHIDDELGGTFVK